jgi:hypothetical protein
MGADIGAVYSVPLARLREAPGSGRRATAMLIQEGFYNREQVDDMFSDYSSPPRTLDEAVRQIMNGEELQPDRGSLYGYAVEALCWAKGKTYFLPIGFPSYKSIDEYLSIHQSPQTLDGLLFSGFPIPIPTPADFPSAGVWEVEEVATMSQFLATLPEASEELASALGEVRRWVDEAAKEGHGLVGFWY